MYVRFSLKHYPFFFFFFFFFNDTATTEIYTLSLHDALPIRLGAIIVEFDVRLSRDGVPVVIHDPAVDRTTGGTGLVHQLSAAELSSLNAGTEAEPTPVPTLAEVLRCVSGRGAIAAEIKNIPC